MNRRTPPLVGTDPLRGLTRRQLQIVQLLKTGASNKEIARVLGISDGTVKVHLHSIYEKLGVAGRCKLVANATKVLLRKQAGRWLRELRENCGLSQSELAAKVGAEYTLSSHSLRRVEVASRRIDIWSGLLHLTSSLKNLFVPSCLTTTPTHKR